MKLTKKLLQDRRLVNSFQVCEAGGGKVFIVYRHRGGSRSMIIPAWKVAGVGISTDPEAHWTDYGSKTFSCSFSRRAEQLEEAKHWASEKYGIEEWVHDPFGGWQDKRVYDRVLDLVKSPPAEEDPDHTLV
jgi:hypothetical protein